MRRAMLGKGGCPGVEARQGSPRLTSAASGGGAALVAPFGGGTVATCARGKHGMSDGGKRGARQSAAR
jgi:hypothetical protein